MRDMGSRVCSSVSVFLGLSGQVPPLLATGSLVSRTASICMGMPLERCPGPRCLLSWFLQQHRCQGQRRCEFERKNRSARERLTPYSSGSESKQHTGRMACTGAGEKGHQEPAAGQLKEKCKNNIRRMKGLPQRFRVEWVGESLDEPSRLDSVLS